MKLSSIRIQGMHNVSDKTYQLDRMNYFLGPNGAGKSTIMQAVQLALLGYIPGTDKKKSAIFHHSNGNFMSVKLIIESDVNSIITITRTWTHKGKDIVATVNTIPENLDINTIIGDVSLPILNFNEFISMTSNKLKDWFINFLPSVDSDIDWDTQLRKEISGFGTILNPDFVTEMVEFVTNMDATGLDKIREFNTYLKQQQSFKKSELTRIQGTIQSLIYYDDCDSSVDIATLMDQNHQDSIIKDNINRQLMLITHNNNIRTQLNQLTEVVCDSLEDDSRYQDNINNIVALDKVISDCNDAITTWTEAVASYTQQLKDKQIIIDGAGVCPYSGTVCDAIAKMLDIFKSDVESLETIITRYQMNITDKNTELLTAKNHRANYERHNTNISAQYSQYNLLKKQLNTDVDGLDESQLKQDEQTLINVISERNDLIIKLEANKQYNELTNVLTTQKFQIEQDLEILKVWIKLTDVNGLQSTIMDVPFHHLAVQVSKYLNLFFGSTDIAASFNLAQGANSFSFGLYKINTNEYIEFDMLSSGEKCLYTLSLLISLIESSATQLPLILIDDLLDHLDTDRIQSCFETLYDIDTVQILLAGVQKCNHPNESEFIKTI